jgi:hypothetical protein
MYFFPVKYNPPDCKNCMCVLLSFDSKNRTGKSTTLSLSPELPVEENWSTGVFHRGMASRLNILPEKPLR